MKDRDINYLIRLYNKPFVKGEKRSKEYERMVKQEKSIEEKKQIADLLILEVPFHVTESQKEHVKYLIDQYPNLKKLHATAKTETIILALIFYTKIGLDGNIRLDKYSITTKYELKHSTFELIICRLCFYYFQNACIVPVDSENKYDNYILYKGEKK